MWHMLGRTPTFPGLFWGVGGLCAHTVVYRPPYRRFGWLVGTIECEQNVMGKVTAWYDWNPSWSSSASLCLGRMTRNCQLSMGLKRLGWCLLVHHYLMSKPVLFCVFRWIINFQSCQLGTSSQTCVCCTENTHHASVPKPSIFQPEPNVHKANDYIGCKGSLREWRPVFICKTGEVCC